jgi:hypothetical protein
MTQEKDLLLKDLCGRLPYRVKASTKIGTNIIVSFIGDDTIIGEDGDSYDISFITPYLFPLSSMTEEQKEEHKDLLDNQYSFDANGNIFTLQDFYCKYHLDFRGLIPMGLAIDATGKNIY